MKKLILIAAVSMLLASCVTSKNIGNLTMVSTRNVETTKQYTLLKKYVTLTKEEIRKTQATSIEQAIDEVVKKVDGGEYLMNVKVYLVQRGGSQASQFFYAVEGDVWGTTVSPSALPNK